VSPVSDVLLGTVPDAGGDEVEVWRNADGTVSLILSADTDDYDTDGYRALTFAPGGLDAVRELLGRAAMPGQPASCAYCEDDPDHPDPDNAGTCTCQPPGCGRGWCPKRDDFAAMPGR
jgi:hypothetical protein